ncbi:MAG: zinc-ribbon domain-containing protein [Ktedonobacteraceae bacterium]|nr:zinc-ribbon domain-containing protein [Ktedonobacteraceae bacterium]
MISCERCGHEIPDNAAICPACGTITSTAQSAQQPGTKYGRPGASYDPPQPANSYGQGYNQQPFGNAPPSQPGYDQQPFGNNFPPQPGYAPPQAGYGQQPFGSFPPQPGYAPPQAGYGQQPFGAAQQQQQGYGYAPPMYPPGVVNVNVINPPSAKNNTALLVEILCSFFGFYGIGWLMSGETTVGAILLICSFVVLWPMAIILAITLIGLFCLVPLGIGLFILNIILLNSRLDRQAAQAQMMVQTPIR